MSKARSKAKNAGKMVSLASKYLRSVRGFGLSLGESPLKLAQMKLQEVHGVEKPEKGEPRVEYLEKHKELMLESIKKNRHLIPKKTKNSRKAFLESYAWRKLRMEALIKYGPKCMCCGATPETGAVMNVDHIKPRLMYPELALDINNLQILCHECNHGKGNWDRTDWRKTS